MTKKVDYSAEAPGEPTRDAIHIGVINAVASEALEPGAYVSLRIVPGRLPVATPSLDGLGIVWPFRKRRAYRGDRIWVMLRPDEITNLRHHWEHPVLDAAEDDKAQAMLRLTRSAKILDVSLEELLGMARRHVETGAILHDQSFESLDIGSMEEFWADYDLVTGTTTTEERRDYFFTCGGCSIEGRFWSDY